MGARVNAEIEMAQKAAGHVPAKGAHLDTLDRMAQTALQLIECITLERAGVCDGAGGWHGSDPIYGLAGELVEIAKRRTSEAHELPAAAADDEIPF